MKINRTMPEVKVTAEHIEQFERDGFLVIEDALSSEIVGQLLQTIDGLEAEFSASDHRRNVFGLDVRPIVGKDPLFFDLMTWPTTFPLAVRFLNHYNLQLMTSHLIKVPPQPGKRNVGWHPDGGIPGIQIGGRRAFTSLKIGYFLTDLLSPNMGSLLVVPGSHRLAGPPVFEAGGSDPVGTVELKIRAGSAVIFQEGLWHAGATNSSDKTRVVLYFGYGFRYLRPIDYIQMPQELLDRCDPIEKQLLGHKATHLGYQAPQDADCPLKPWFQERFGNQWLPD
ncbi:hypothetical protein DXT96_21480 [Agrobacterium sp. ICMP 6402]|uniref:phytanoyl-CoA dioxygenase family protein n=1 Tax=Agrobacterium sp. ICMP 6402 TaxID=2292443 RepID=UPI0012975F8A|nr:phytanoyl-CoA dioxygenase family protein [Agrobacterium sp. ICMP 6402]MQB12418.1 hypothetical protein [Agrobacterium sp. ICMP 6402]